MVQRTRRAALEPLPGNDSKAGEGARRRLAPSAPRGTARRRGGAGAVKRRSDELSSRSDSTHGAPSPPASPAAALPRAKALVQTFAGFLMSPMAHVRSRSQYAGTKRKRGGGASASGLSRASAKASGSATPSREDRLARPRACDESRGGPSHALRRDMSNLALDEGPRTAPTRRASRSAEAAAPEQRRTSFSRQASGSRSRQTVASPHEDDGDTADEGDLEEGSAQHLSAEEEMALRCSASSAKLMRQRISLLQRLHEISVGETDSMMTKQQLTDAIIAARSPPRRTRKRGLAGATRRSPVSSSSTSSYTTFGSEEEDHDETVAEVRAVAGRVRAAPQATASSPAVRRLRAMGSERGGFAKSSPVKTRARSRHSVTNRRARPAARMSRTAATAASPRKPALRPRRAKAVVFSQRVKRMEIDGSGEEVTDEEEAGEPDEGAADASGEASSAVGSEEDDTSEGEQQHDERLEPGESDSDETGEIDAPGDDTFEISDGDESMSVDGRSPPPPRRRAGSGRATVPVVTPPVRARNEMTRSRIAMPPPQLPLRPHRPRARPASPDSDDVQDGAGEAGDDDEALAEEEEEEMEDDDDIDDVQHASPSKIRKLRNGKQLRIHTPSGSSSTRAARADPAEGSNEEESESEAESEEEHEDEAEEDDPMADPKQATLARLRLARLAELCEERDIDTRGKKAFLIDRLLQHHRARTAAAAPSSQASHSSADSATTERPASSTAGKKGKGKMQPVVANAPGRKRSAAHVPLLLRSHSRQTLASKPDSPALDPCNPDAQPAEAVDELNGLDLESLNLLDKEIPPHRLEKLEKIGSGGFKDVYVGKYFHQKSRAQKVAIADIRDDLTEMDIKELSLLRDLRHENIVRFIGVSIPDAPRHVPCMIVSELCTNGDLFDYIRNVPAPSNDDIFRIMLETARGIEYLHGRDPAIIHRDIKSTNILITRDRHAKINDFGLARVKNTRRSMMRSLVGTVNWQAAELWRPKPHYNEKVDVWSVAMTFWETLQWHEKVKKYPFEGMNEHQIYLEVGGDKRVRPKTTNIRRLFGDGIVELLERMWDAQPRLRPTMSDVCSELERLMAEARAAARAARRA